MNWYFIFYLIAMINNFSNTFLTLWIIAAVVLTVTSIVWIFNEESIESDGRKIGHEIRDKTKMIMKIALPVFVVFISLYLFTPNRNSMLLIVSGGSVGEFIRADTNAQKIPSEIFEYLRGELKIQFDNKKIQDLKEDLSFYSKEQLIEELSNHKKKEFLEE